MGEQQIYESFINSDYLFDSQSLNLINIRSPSSLVILSFSQDLVLVIILYFYICLMSKGSIELIQPIIVTKIVLLRKRRVPHTFEEKVFSYFAHKCDSEFQIQQFGDEETSYGNLPLAIINHNHLVQMNLFIQFAQALYQPSPEIYLLQKSVVNNSLRLREFDKLDEIESQSDHWLLHSPLKRIRQYLKYRHHTKQLIASNISPDNRENQYEINKTIQEFQKLLVVEDTFSRTIQYLCLDYLIEHKNQISKTIMGNKKIMQAYKKGIPEQKKLPKPIIADLIKSEKRQQEPTEKNQEQGIQALLKTLMVLSIIWVPWLFYKGSSE